MAHFENATSLEHAGRPPERPALQRALGEARVVARRDGAINRLDRLYQDGCAKIRLPRDRAARSLEAVMINTSGGLTGGDRMSWRAEAREAACLTLTTQACEKVYRARDDRAEVQTTLVVEAGARLDWLPQETILFDGAAISRRIDADLAGDARLLVLEAVVLGRTAMGETVHRGELRDRWRIRRQGRLIFADDIAFSGPIGATAGLSPVLGGARAFASMVLAADDAERLIGPVRAAVGEAGGASAFDGKLFCRIAAGDGMTLRKMLSVVLQTLRDGDPLPRVWHI